MSSEEVVHKGGCHCGAVRFEAIAPAEVDVFNCNCTICVKKQFRPFIVHESKFKIVKGEDNLTLYTYNKHIAKHYFCKTCGVQSFYRPRSNQQGYGIMTYCVDPGTITKETVSYFDGVNYEESLEQWNKDRQT